MRDDGDLPQPILVGLDVPVHGVRALANGPDAACGPITCSFPRS